MKFLILLMGTTFSVTGLAAVDYSYCQKLTNNITLPNTPCSSAQEAANPGSCKPRREKSDKYSFYPYELTAEGKIVPHPSVSFTQEDNKEVLEFTTNGSKIRQVLSKNTKGELVSIVNDVKAKIGVGTVVAQSNTVITTNFEIKNGKCIPSRVDSLAMLGNEARHDVIYDTQLCKNLHDFFRKNVDAAACFNQGYIAQVQNIFKDYYTRNVDIYGEKAVANIYNDRPTPMKTKLNPPPQMPGYTNARFLNPGVPTVDSSVLLSNALFATTPVTSAAIINANCSNSSITDVVGEVLLDDSVWKLDETGKSTETTATTK